MANQSKNLIIIAGGSSSRFSKNYPLTHKMLLPWKKKLWIDEFLDVVINLHGFEKIFFSLGVYHQQIVDYLNFSKYRNFCNYVIENQPLGTGGGTLKVFNEFALNESIVMNCDSLYFGDLQSLCSFTLSRESPICISLIHMEDCSRYGSVIVENDRIVSFHEKRFSGSGLISAGIYKIKKDLFNSFQSDQKFSIEHDIFENIQGKMIFKFKMLDGKFIDIGTPKDYEQYIHKYVNSRAK